MISDLRQEAPSSWTESAEYGAALVEWVLLVFLIAVVVMAAAAVGGGEVSGIFSEVSSSVSGL
ncbi:MAG: hypothetical protein ACRDVM_02510 [Acidimicrobiia bacterium]